MPRAAGPFAAGSPYSAAEESALRWVHATLVDSALLAHALLFPPLSDKDRERYLAESRIFAALFGIPQAGLPQTWIEFAAYNAAMLESSTLTVTPEARSIARQILCGTTLWIEAPRWYRALTALLLPARLRKDFELPHGEAEFHRAEAALARIRRIYPRLPERLRFVGPYQEAMARISGAPRPGILVQWSNRLWIGRPHLG
jgi:uncharacterized protein (DUF2236 family)